MLGPVIVATAVGAAICGIFIWIIFKFPEIMVILGTILAVGSIGFYVGTILFDILGIYNFWSNI